MAAGVEQCSRFKAGHSTVAAVGAVGVTGYTAVALNQVAECLISPVGRINIRELGDASDLVSSNCRLGHGGIIGDTCDIDFGRASSHRSQKAQCCGSNKQLLEEFHGVPHTKNRGAQIVREKGMDARDRDNSNDPKKRLTDTQKQVSKDSQKKLPTF